MSLEDQIIFKYYNINGYATEKKPVRDHFK